MRAVAIGNERKAPACPMSKMQKLGFKNARERRIWIETHKGKIVEYAQTHSRTETCTRFCIGVPTFRRICGSYGSVNKPSTSDILRERWECIKRIYDEGEAIGTWDDLLGCTKNVILMYDMASKGAGVEESKHRKEFVKIAITADYFARLAGIAASIGAASETADKIVNCMNAILASAFHTRGRIGVANDNKKSN